MRRLRIAVLIMVLVAHLTILRAAAQPGSLAPARIPPASVFLRVHAQQWEVPCPPPEIHYETDPGTCQHDCSDCACNRWVLPLPVPGCTLYVITCRRFGDMWVCALPGQERSVCTPLSVGTNEFQFTVSNTCGSDMVCRQIVHVRDAEVPQIACPSDVTVTCGFDQCNVDVGQPQVNDNCGIASVVGVRDDGQALTAPYPRGKTRVTWQATDVHGNVITCTQSITVIGPTFLPLIRLSG